MQKIKSFAAGAVIFSFFISSMSVFALGVDAVETTAPVVEAAAPAAAPVLVDTTPPDITLVTETSITATGATIGFTTSEVGNTQIEYGTTAGYGSESTFDANLGLTHTVTLSGLSANTLYHYRIRT